MGTSIKKLVLDKGMLGKLIFSFAGFFLAFSFLFCFYFLTSSLEELKIWFLRLNSCFYLNSNWSIEVFTAGKKSIGNYYCYLALLITGLLTYMLVKAQARKFENRKVLFEIQYRDQWAVVILGVLCVGFWLWGNWHISPAFDEVFSAVNCAGIHPFQSLSYYMLPNNHLGFNFVNGVVFHFFSDKVYSGRFISLIAYIGIAVTVYYFFRYTIKIFFYSLFATVVVLLQFAVWGFSFQARGYEWYAFAEILTFVSVFVFSLSGNKIVLYINTISCIVGFFFVPTFMYIFVAQFIYLAIWHIVKRNNPIHFLRLQFVSLSVIFILHLPALCFSGKSLLLENPYVSPGGDLKWILERALPYLQEYATYTYSAIISEYNWMNDFLFLFPLLLFFFYKNREKKYVAFFYLLMWCVLYAIVFKMKKFPFMRNSIGHVALSLMFFLYTVFSILSYISFRLNKKFPVAIFFSLILVLLGEHFVVQNNEWFNPRLYNYSINGRNDTIRSGLTIFPEGCTIGFSDEAFYWYYEYAKKHKQASLCLSGDEQFIIKNYDEPFPARAKQENYVFFKKIEIYEIYKRK